MFVTTLLIISIVLALMASAFFSAAETAITSVSTVHIHKLVQEENPRAKIVADLQQNKDMLISAILLGNNAANIFSSAVTTMLMLKSFGDGGALYTTVLLTAVVLVCCEITPKSYALDNAESLALRLAPSLHLLLRILLPISKGLRAIAYYLMRLLGLVTRKSSMSAYDNLRVTIDLHHHEGEMVKSDRDMLGSILDLRDVTVEQAMIHRTKIVSIDIDLSQGEFVEAVLSAVNSRIPLWQGSQDNIVAVIHVKDLLKLLNAKPKANKKDILAICSPPWFISEHTLLKEQLRQFQLQRQHMALVVGEFGDLQGLITLEDILEEIVGSIEDEHDISDSSIVVQADGSVLVSGDVPIRDLNRQFDWDFDDESSATIAGLVVAESGEIPKAGTELAIKGLKLTVIRRSDSRILMLRIVKIEPT